jgi:SAM-dependent methyltransferase
MTRLEFRSDLYHGVAGYYDAFRRPYPAELISELAARTGADGTRRLLDLACGTGQVAFALRDQFAEIWAVDQEPGMIAVAREKAAAAGDAARWRFVTAGAEELNAPHQAFSLITIGNAFHRLRRDVAAARVRNWLKPGGYVALLWGGSPAEGGAAWQQALRETMLRWQLRAGTDKRIPAGYEADRAARQDREILDEAGLEVIGRFEFAVSHRWSEDAIAGYLASTSVLSAVALGENADSFDRDLRRSLRASEPGGEFRQEATFAYDLARRPAAATAAGGRAV